MTADDLHMEPAAAVEVAALLVTCGMCAAQVLVEYEALDHEHGRIDPCFAFEECPECGVLLNAQAVAFNAYLVEGGDL
ncbi:MULTISPECIES: hypothetical protein [unclassified Haematobacter]|uniref:hypothetical protein n=1 Tax=unclassified Haematobacter TaxID=2640585 RepID=UPI0025C520B6|nr:MULTISPECIES: hypothetical protein [unclassified Haematobacter]